MGIKIRNRVRGGSLCSIPCAFASIAQLVEQRTLNPWVVGSNPPGGIFGRFRDFLENGFFIRKMPTQSSFYELSLKNDTF